ncbi:hypothetical protein Sjap_004449 [Stephania japonica]|uniref:Acyl-coenzyme A oxidase n=1 Tax=Stephania japonica TaxID=461633 RepID=A0AAP0K2J8_9MAGN
MERASVDHLAHERNKAQFDVEAMKIVWAGSKHAFDVSNRMARLVASDPVFDKGDRHLLGRKELFKEAMRKAAHGWRLINELRLSDEVASRFRSFIDEPSFIDAHWEMFVPTIKGQCNEEQKQKWLPLANKLQIIGCYAQTELGHGSNVRGLETTATFDPISDEFVINSPTLTSTKWWPGGLGKASTHAIVFARLKLGTQDHGVHGFIVQLRSLDDHVPLPGITIGDIGMKFGNGGYNAMDNGFLRLSQVTREGKFLESNVPRQLVYSAMIYVRQTIVSDASIALSRAACIATRYSAIRRQFGSHDGGLETQLIDYKTQQSRLFPLLASAYAFRFVGEWLKLLYTDLTRRILSNDFSTLPETHSCTAGLKSLTTSITAGAIDECRKLCGGHGYLCSSGLPQLFAAYVPACTYEGENYVMLVQVSREGRFSAGFWKTLHRNNSLYEASKTFDALYLQDWLKPCVSMEVFEARSMRMLIACAQNISKMPNQEEGFAELSSDLAEAATAHCQLIVVSKFIEKLRENIPGEGVKDQLEVLCNIYILSLIHKHKGDFLSTRCITPKQASLANDQLRRLYTQVSSSKRNHLVDAFNHTDHYLGSVLGRYDGNVYPKLYEEAWRDPLNDSVVPDGYTEYLRPMLKQQLHNARL